MWPTLMFDVLVGCEALNKMLNVSSSMSSSSSASYNKYNSLDRCHNGVKHTAIMLSNYTEPLRVTRPLGPDLE